MNQLLVPLAPTPIPEISTPGMELNIEQPTVSEVADVENDSAEAKRRKIKHPASVADDKLATIVNCEATTVVAAGGGNIVPAWFGPAVHLAVQKALQPIRADIAAIRADIANLGVLMKNGQIRGGSDTIFPLQNNEGEVPDGFPHTKDDLDGLPSAACNKLMAFYGLHQIKGHNHAAAGQKRRLLKTHLGIY